MLDYVRRSELDAEREQRIRAEAQRDAAVTETARQAAALESERAAQQAELMRLHAQMTELINRALPLKSPDAPPGEAVPPARPLTVMELVAATMDEVAIGPKACEAKRNKIDELLKLVRNGPETPGTQAGNGDDDLTEAERERVAAL